MIAEPRRQTDRALLDPVLRQRFEGWEAEVAANGFQIQITETLRSAERQEWLREQGKSKVSRSHHQDGKAVDIVIIDESGAADWDLESYRALYRQCDPRRHGITSGGHLWDWDWVHLQLVELQGEGDDV